MFHVSGFTFFFVEEFNSRAFIVHSTKLSITQAHRRTHTQTHTSEKLAANYRGKTREKDTRAKHQNVIAQRRGKRDEDRKKSNMEMETEKEHIHIASD